MRGCPLRKLFPFLFVLLLSPVLSLAFQTRRGPVLNARPRSTATATASLSSAFGWSSSKRRATTTSALNIKTPATTSTSTSSPTSTHTTMHAAHTPIMAAQLHKVTGGASPAKASFSFSALWGVLGVVAVLGNAIRRLLPIALEPFSKAAASSFTPLLWAQYIGFALVMAYAEGYKGFQLKFSPLVVKRAFTLGPDSPFHHKLFAAPYSMGLFHASKKRQIVSWSLALGIVALVKVVKSLAFPYRSIVDAGVVVGLSWGTASIVGIYLQAVVKGKKPEIDPAMPEKSN